MDEVFKDQDLVLILLGSLLEEYELLEITLLNGKDDVSLGEVCAALYSKELRRKDTQISSSRGQSLQRESCSGGKCTKCDDEESDLSLATSSSRNASEIWLLDFACSHHITPHREWFCNFKEHEKIVYTANENPLTTHGIGFVRLQNEDETIVTLKGVRYSPKLKKNHIFVGTLESKGFEVRAKDGVMKIISGILVVMKEVVKLWHMRLGHAGKNFLNFLIKQGLLKGLSSCKLDLYEHCINKKTTWVKFGTSIHKTQGILDYVHSDVWGPSKTRSLGGRHYYVTFIDDFSRRIWVYTLKIKDEAEVVMYAYHLVNRLPSTDIDGETPFEKWITHGIKGHCLWCQEKKKIIFTKDVTFNESAMLKKVNVEQLDETPKKVEFERIIIPADRETDDNSPMVEG
ncbi:retrovirus-related pol polyprotein from transposon TNT 1-94, partial [Tanacetum coccineum]